MKESNKVDSAQIQTGKLLHIRQTSGHPTALVNNVDGLCHKGSGIYENVMNIFSIVIFKTYYFLILWSSCNI